MRPPAAPADLADGAKRVLEENWLGDATRPGPHLYPHQWSWDAAFIAIGYATFAPERGWQELRSLFAGQWKSGLVPHIVFHPEAGAYFPGPDVWRTAESGLPPDGVRTSGIVQPPLHATAARRLFEATPEPAEALQALEELVPKLAAWHDYLYRERDPDGDGLVAIRHPWESGQDDSPAWDVALGAVPLDMARLPAYRRVDLTMAPAEERPTQSSYDVYMALVECFKESRYDETEIRRRCPFQVEDVLFNSLLARAGEDLAVLAESLGWEGERFRRQAAGTRAGVNGRLWSDRLGHYMSYDRREGRRLPPAVAGSFAPLFAGIPDGDRAHRLLELLSSPRFWQPGAGYGIPSCDRLAPAFSPRRYWRGPVWPNLNWLIRSGLRGYGFETYADALRDVTLELVKRSGFREYFDPRRGEGLGSESFSWTAALVLDLLAEA